jgi:hypothetical protein
MKTVPHPPYSPDITPSDFYLFGYVKGCLAGRSLVDAEEFFEAVPWVLNVIKKMILHTVFLEWMDRRTKCIQTNGEDTKYTERFVQIRLLLTQ